jgi:regulator of protease activity HflC (stomatin/prohibitin superfamily)
MIWFIIFIILALATVVYAIIHTVTKKDRDGAPLFPVFIGVAATLISLFFATSYTQDPGEAKVLKSWTGDIVGDADTEPGLSFKAPWVDAIDYDIRNQQAAYIGSGNDDYNGKKPDGPQITIQDRDGASADMDVVVRYSIVGDQVTNVYRDFGSQEQFKQRLITQDIRSIARNAPTGYSTIDVLTKRGDIEKTIFSELKTRWDKQGVQVESVALQEIRYSDSVRNKFNEAQNARTEVVKAQAELEATQISAQQKVVQAKAEADANNLLAASLTEPILRQRYLDTLGKLAAEGNVFMTTPDGGVLPTLPVK